MQTLEGPAAILPFPFSGTQVDEYGLSHLGLLSTGLQLHLSLWEGPRSSDGRQLGLMGVAHCAPDARSSILLYSLGMGSCATSVGGFGGPDEQNPQQRPERRKVQAGWHFAPTYICIATLVAHLWPSLYLGHFPQVLPYNR